ncbi:MAG: hypothetical protein IE923_10745 [Micrococcales bacterium]|uniref:hypothetical protein n=1 Tax=Cellulomonas sp. P4 TaxID=3142533 RepID=UPI0019969C1B|nr:hypothetical protein [Micrococcales bacterium]
MSIDVDHGALTAIAEAMVAAGQDLDGTCASQPSSPGTGDAAPLLGDILATVSGTVALLAYEADVIGTQVAECERAYDETDRTVSRNLSSMFDGAAGR